MVAGLLASACGAKGADEAADNDKATQTTAAGSTETTAAGDSASKFGSIASPCGKADSVATVKADEAGRAPTSSTSGSATTATRSVGSPEGAVGRYQRLRQVVQRAGRHQHLQLEAVDLDGKVLEVEAAMAKACTDVFAIVGGGWAQDNFIFSGKDGADFHKCKMISFPGFAVSTDFAEGSDQVQPLPNPAYDKPASAMVALAKLYPDEVKKFGVVYGTLPSIIQNKDQIIGVAKQTKGFDQFDEIGYDIINQDWAVIAQQVLDKGLKAVSFVGEPPNMSKFAQALRDQGFDGVINADANQYDSRLIGASGPAAVEGAIVRIASHTYEEADKWPAMGQLVKILDSWDPAWERAGLATQAFSASLLFATAAKSCADAGEISRACVLEAGKDIHEWDGGGLHAVADPGANTPADCAMLVQIKDGKFERLFPELGSDDDNGEGFFCSPTVKLTGDFGQGNTDSSILGS